MIFSVLRLYMMALVLLTSPALFAETMQERSIIVLPNDLDTEISSRVDIFADATGKMNIEDIVKKDFDGFQRNRVAGYSLGVFAGNLWLRLTLKSESNGNGTYILQLDKPLLDVRFFQRQGGTMVEQFGGRSASKTQETMSTTFPAFRLEAPVAGEVKDYYVMIRNDGVHSLSLSLRTTEQAWSRDRLHSWFGGFASGVILIMICYNLFLFYSTRESDFLWYSLTVFFLHYGHIAGNVTNSVFYAGKLPFVPEVWVPLSKILGTMALVQFTRIFLRTKELSLWVDRILRAVLVYSIAMLVSLGFLPSASVNALHNIGAFIGLMTVIGYSGYLFAKGNKYARFYFIAWFPMLLVAMLYVIAAMTARGHLLQNIQTILTIAAMVEVLLLSLALGDKINVLREEKRMEEELARAQKEEADRLHREEILRINASLEIKVQEKTADIRALLDNLPMAVMSVQEDATIGAHVSKHSTDVLGIRLCEGDSLLGTIFDRVDLGADQKAGMAAAVCASIGPDSLGFLGNESFLIRRFVSHRNGQTRFFEADWSPIETDNGQVRALLLCVKDVTEIEALRADAIGAETRGRAMSEILLAGFDRVGTVLNILNPAFQDYVHKIKCAADAEALIAGGGIIQQESISFFRTLHTQKAMARSLKLMALADAIHALEDVVSKLRGIHGSGLSLPEFLTAAEAFKQVLKLYENGYSSIVAASQSSGFERSELSVRTVGVVVQEILQALPEIASLAGKPIPRIQIYAPAGQELSSLTAQKLLGMLTHLLRNSLDHGIEPAAERMKAGKNAEGLIKIEICDIDEGQMRVSLTDDGSGFNARRVAQKAKDKGIDGVDMLSAEEIIFLPGFSSKEQVSELSGRGVGLDAVRCEARELGGDARAILKAEPLANGNQAISFEITLRLAA
jgi:hypothetical protein